MRSRKPDLPACLRLACATMALMIIAMLWLSESASLASTRHPEFRKHAKCVSNRYSLRHERPRARRMNDVRQLCHLHKHRHATHPVAPADRPSQPPNPASSVSAPAPGDTPSCIEPVLHITPEIVNGENEITGAVYLNGGPAPSSGCTGVSLPAASTVTVTTINGEVIATQAVSEGQHYSVTIPPGTYVVTAGCGSAAPVTVTVSPGKQVLLDFVCQIH